MTLRNDNNASRPGVRDVAREAGVSRTTVSHALSGKGRVSEETRARVAAVAAELGYRTNVGARNLTRRRSGLVALAASPIDPSPLGLVDVDYFLRLSAAASEAALREGYALVAMPSGDQRELWDSVALDGAIVTDPLPDDPFVRDCLTRRMPVVTVGRDLARPDAVAWVDNDLKAAATDVLDHLAESGARRIALISEPGRHSYSRDEIQAYESWCAARKMSPRREEAPGNRTEEGYRAALRLFADPEPPDAICTTLDGLALGVLLAAEREGVAVPGSLLLAATSDGDAMQNARTPITAVDLAPADIGRAAVASLLGQIDAGGPVPSSVVVPPRLVIRASTQRHPA